MRRDAGFVIVALVVSLSTGCALRDRKWGTCAIGGAVVGSCVALLLNDSGVSSWMFTTVAVLMLLLDEQLRAQR